MINMAKIKFDKNLKKLIRALNHLDLISVVLICIEKLRSVDNKEVKDYKGWIPWYVLVMIRWAFEFGRLTFPKKQASNNDVALIINAIQDLGKFPHFLADQAPHSTHKFLRVTAFQQFWFQQELELWQISRQILLFMDLPEEHSIARRFMAKTKISIAAFFELTIVMWNWVQSNPSQLHFEKFEIENSPYDWEYIRRYLSLITLHPRDAAKFFDKRRRSINNRYLQLFERSPLIRYPILLIQNRYYVYSRRLLGETIRTFVYLLLRDDDPEGFSQEFGSVFEDYLQHGISRLGIPFIRDVEQQTKYVTKKSVDYLLEYPDAYVLIEAKAIELTPQAKVNPETEVLIKELRGSIGKAVIQGFSVIRAICQWANKDRCSDSDDFFLLIVTYGELYLWNGAEAWSEFLEESVSEELNQLEIPLETLAPGKIFFLSIEAFDLLISRSVGLAESLPDILREYSDRNRNQNANRFDVTNAILQDMSNHTPRLDYLDNRVDQFLIDTHAKFTAGKSAP